MSSEPWVSRPSACELLRIVRPYDDSDLAGGSRQIKIPTAVGILHVLTSGTTQDFVLRDGRKMNNTSDNDERKNRLPVAAFRIFNSINMPIVYAQVRFIESGLFSGIRSSISSNTIEHVEVSGTKILVNQVRSRIQEEFYSHLTEDWSEIDDLCFRQKIFEISNKPTSVRLDLLMIKATSGPFRDHQYVALLTPRRIDLSAFADVFEELNLLMVGNASRSLHRATLGFTREFSDGSLIANLGKRLLTRNIKTWKKTLGANLFRGISPRSELPSDFILPDQSIRNLERNAQGLMLRGKGSHGFPQTLMQQIDRSRWGCTLLIPIFALEGLIGLVAAVYDQDYLSIRDLETRIQLIQFDCRTQFRDQFDLLPATTVEQQFVRLAPMVSTGLSANLLIHDLNALLGNVNFGMQRVAKHFIGTESYRDLTAITEQLAECIETVRSVSRMSTGRLFEKRRLNVVSLINSALSVHARRRKDLGCSLKFTESRTISIIGDRMALEQVFSNIVSNALYFLSEYSHQKDKELLNWSPELRVLCETSAGFARVEFVDNGPGIPSTHLRTVFEYFYTSKGPKGTGLGLSVSKMILESHNGSIEAVECVTGAHIRVRIPLAT